MRTLRVALVLTGLFPLPLAAQLGIQTPDQANAAPYIACRAWFGISDTIYATPDAPNHAKGRARFRYYAEKLAKESGRNPPNVDCYQFIAMGDDLRNDHTVGFSYYNRGWKRQVTVVAFPGLPADWSTRPVPGEDGEKKAAVDPGDLRTITYAYAKGTPTDPGYDYASISVNYRFLACMGEVHVAYSLDPKSVRASDNYHSRNGLVPVGAVPVPEPISIEMVAAVLPNPQAREFGRVQLRDRYGRVEDKLAAPALGYGCFTGQTQKIGLVKDFIIGKVPPNELDAVLNDALVLTHQFIGMRSLKRPLRNAALDAAKTSRQLEEEERAANDAAEAERRRKFIEAETARVQAREAKLAAEAKAYADAQAKFQRDLAAKQAADEKYAADLARHEADMARVAEERRRYEAAMEEYRRTKGRSSKPD